MTEKITEIKEKKFVNLASVNGDKYLFFDKPISKIPKPNVQFQTFNLQNLISAMCTVDAV